MKDCGCIVVYDDYGPEQNAFWAKWVVARKEHICVECGEIIAKGEKYMYERGVWDGRFEAYHTCEACKYIRDDVYCGAWIYGELRNAFHDLHGFDYVDGPEEE